MSLIQPLPLLSSARSGRTLRLRRDADHAGAVVAGRGDRAGDVRAVAVAVLREVVLGDEVPALVVVDEAVAVVVDAVGLAPVALLAGVAGELALQVLVGGVDAGVDDRDGDARADAALPGLGRVDVASSAGVVEAPERGPVGVVGRVARDRAVEARRRRRRRRRAARRAPRRRRRRAGSTSSVRSIGSVSTRLDARRPGAPRGALGQPGSRWTMMSPSSACAVAGAASSDGGDDEPRTDASRVPSAVARRRLERAIASQLPV